MIKSKHRAMSLLLVVILAMSAFCVSGFSVFAAATDESSVSAGGTLVYLKNTRNWSNVYVYYWLDDNDKDHPDWPGTLMNRVEGTTDIYYFEVPSEKKFVIFNNGEGGGGEQRQTDNLNLSNCAGNVYDPIAKSWTPYSGYDVPTDPKPTGSPNPTQQPTTAPPVTGDNVVYCQNDAGWSTVYCYMWNGGGGSGNENAGWPGVRMENLGDNVWCYELPQNYEKIIFNSGNNGSKTGDMNYPGTGHIYNNKTDTWEIYDTSPIRITGFTTDIASPQYKGMDITITSNATSSQGTVSYKYTVKNTSTNNEITLSNFSASNTVVWTPTEVGEYVITVYVQDTANNQNKREMNYTIQDDSNLVRPVIKGISPADNSQVQLNSQVSVKVNAGGGKTGTNLLFAKYVVTDPNGAKNVAYYILDEPNKPFKFIPTTLGEYKVQVYVQGSDNQTVNKTFTYQCVGQVVTSTPIPTSAPIPTTDPIPTKPDDVLGDVNGDGRLGIEDAALIQLRLAYLTTFTEKQEALADFNKDGKVNIRDVTEIQLTLAGLLVG